MRISIGVGLNMGFVLTLATSGANARRQHGDMTVSALAPAVHRPETARWAPKPAAKSCMSAAAGVPGASEGPRQWPLCVGQDFSRLGINAGHVLIAAANFSGDGRPCWAHSFWAGRSRAKTSCRSCVFLGFFGVFSEDRCVVLQRRYKAAGTDSCDFDRMISSKILHSL